MFGDLTALFQVLRSCGGICLFDDNIPIVVNIRLIYDAKSTAKGKNTVLRYVEKRRQNISNQVCMKQ
jgi:hypothetical protein